MRILLLMTSRNHGTAENITSFNEIRVETANILVLIAVNIQPFCYFTYGLTDFRLVLVVRESEVDALGSRPLRHEEETLLKINSLTVILDCLKLPWI